VYSVKDLYPGQTLEVTVLPDSPAAGGLLVALTPTLKGVVPPLHMTDAAAAAAAGGGSEKGSSSSSSRKFRPGKTLAARCVVV
jgi:hypothetical protein